MSLPNCSLPLLLLLLLLFGFAASADPTHARASKLESSAQASDVGSSELRASGGVEAARATPTPAARRRTTPKRGIRATLKSRHRTTGAPRLGERRNCGRAPLHSDITGYIVSGENATRGEFPSFARVKVVGSILECGGVLISSRHVLTAAHCANAEDKMRIVLGDHNRLKRDGRERAFDVRRACWSPNFAQDFPGIRHDWLVLELNSTVKFNNWIQPACMPRTLPKTSGKLSNCYLMGFGFSTFNETLADDPFDPYRAGITPATLQKMKVEQVACDRRYGIPKNDPSRVCYIFANRKRRGGSCYGDSGSPVLCQNATGRWTVTALVSNGKYPYCGFKSASAVQTIYTNVNRALAGMDKHCKHLLIK